MFFSVVLICLHFLCGQVGFGGGIKPRRYTGTLTLRFAHIALLRLRSVQVDNFFYSPTVSRSLGTVREQVVVLIHPWLRPLLPSASPRGERREASPEARMRFFG